jgi:proteasome lid subunit RPN8/RPN11
MEPARPTELTTVAVYPFRADAEIALARLSADGIAAVIRQDDEGGLNPGFFKRYGVRVEVGVEDLGDARESLGIEHVEVPRPVFDAMFAHSGWCRPNEACGLVAFDGEKPAFVFCLTNSNESEHRFTIDPPEHFGSIRLSERLGFEIGGMFHSHIRSEAYPSQSDIAGGADPEWIHFIVGPVIGSRPLLRGFRIVDGAVEELSVGVGE